ncbi:MAG: hypothetical protein FI699_03180 [SAR202 cluster bacterium]|nr:hypothetical protein [SAR202 cluster bacterium]|tara:strand:- start:1731 stop:1958 length:228 start_codon:yes stop_codon:yes gene_type:complete
MKIRQNYRCSRTKTKICEASAIPDEWGLIDENPKTTTEAHQKQVKSSTQKMFRAIDYANSGDLMKAFIMKIAEAN